MDIFNVSQCSYRGTFQQGQEKEIKLPLGNSYNKIYDKDMIYLNRGFFCGVNLEINIAILPTGEIVWLNTETRNNNNPYWQFTYEVKQITESQREILAKLHLGIENIFGLRGALCLSACQCAFAGYTMDELSKKYGTGEKQILSGW